MPELTQAETELAEQLGYDLDVCEQLKAAGSGAGLTQIIGYDDEGDDRGGSGLCVAIERDEARRRVEEMQPAMLQQGYMVFHGERRSEESGVLEHDTLALLKTADDRDIIRAAGTYANERDLGMDELLEQLDRWTAAGGKLTVVGAAGDWIELKVAMIPGGDPCAFAVEVYEFCPDSVDQGSGLMNEDDDPELFAAARQTCLGDVPALRDLIQRKRGNHDRFGRALDEMYEEIEPGVKLLAHSIAQGDGLFLWWD